MNFFLEEFACGYMHFPVTYSLACAIAWHSLNIHSPRIIALIPDWLKCNCEGWAVKLKCIAEMYRIILLVYFYMAGETFKFGVKNIKMMDVK